MDPTPAAGAQPQPTQAGIFPYLSWAAYGVHCAGTIENAVMGPAQRECPAILVPERVRIHDVGLQLRRDF
jgi:hypothetical protein